MKRLGIMQNGSNAEVYEIEGKRIALNYSKWTGSLYKECREVDEKFSRPISEKKYTIVPIYKDITEDIKDICDYIILENN